MSWKSIFKKLGLYWLWKSIWYRIDWRKPNYVDVKTFLQEQVMSAWQMKQDGRIPTLTGTADEKVRKALIWVHDNITYEKDEKRFGVVEKWQTLMETLAFKKGDCEDGAILLYCIARVNGVSAGQLNVVAGDVQGGGHCWVEYFPDEFYTDDADITDRDTWYTIDWCYWYDKRKFNQRPAKNKDKYLKPWFTVTDFEV